MGQLTLDGREVDVLFARRQRPLTPVQTMILRMVAIGGSIRTVQAGVLIHDARGHCGLGAKSTRRTARRRENKIECCPYAHADGLEAMKRLQARGLVRRTFLRGRWVQA